jgi:hypothetical protein
VLNGPLWSRPWHADKLDLEQIEETLVEDHELQEQAQANLRGTGIGDRALSQTTLDLGITWRLTTTAGCAVRLCGWNLSA